MSRKILECNQTWHLVLSPRILNLDHFRDEWSAIRSPIGLRMMADDVCSCNGQCEQQIVALRHPFITSPAYSGPVLQVDGSGEIWRRGPSTEMDDKREMFSLTECCGE